MKTLTVVIVALLMTASVNVYAGGKKQKNMEVCDRIADNAKAIMTMRQFNYDVRQVIENVDANTGGDAYTGMVIDAYEQPSYNSGEYQALAIREFSNKYALACIQAMR